MYGGHVRHLGFPLAAGCCAYPYSPLPYCSELKAVFASESLTC